MNQPHKYSPQQLRQLHAALYELLGEIIRVCDKLHIGYFLIGGSAIGVHFWEGIIPFDDDIDIGMTRDNYDRFLKEAPSELGPDFFLQWLATDAHTPYYFAKLRRNGTLFEEPLTATMPIHQGIFVDIIPFDRIPDSPAAERRQRKVAMMLACCLQAKEVWLWRWLGRPAVDPPQKQSFVGCVIIRTVATLLPKRAIYWLHRKAMTWYDHRETACYNNVMIAADHIAADALAHLEHRKFGPFMATVPARLEEYLHFHYPTLRKHLSQEEIDAYSHAPQRLLFAE